MNTEYAFPELLYRTTLGTNKEKYYAEFYLHNSKLYLKHTTRPKYSKKYTYKNFFKTHFNINKYNGKYIEMTMNSLFSSIRIYMNKHNIITMSIDDFIEYIKHFPRTYIVTNNLAAYISGNPIVEFERTDENCNDKTFDYISISFSIIKSGRSTQEVVSWIRENKNHIHNLIEFTITPKLESKYGIPFNCLKVDDCVFTNDSRLIYTLSLKNIQK